MRRHLLGEIIENEALCRLRGYAFIFDRKSETFVRRPGQRTTIVDLAPTWPDGVGGGGSPVQSARNVPMTTR